MKSSCLRVFAAVWLAGCTAFAGTVTFESDLASFTSDTDPTQTVTIGAFDQNLGVLIDVSIIAIQSGGADFIADNDDPTTGPGPSLITTANVSRAFSVGLPRGATLNVTGGAFSSGVGLSPENGDGANFDPNPNDGFDFGTVAYGPLESNPVSDPNIAFYQNVGPGTLDLDITPTDFTDNFTFSGNPNPFQEQIDNQNLDVRIRITYNYIPEPGTVALLGVGLGSLMLFRRVQRNRK